MAKPAAYKLSVIIPAYNEEATVHQLLDAVFAAELPGEGSLEVVAVDDASRDSTYARLQQYQQAHPGYNLLAIQHAYNRGKGAALHTGIELATGDYVIIQDADLEYDPQEYQLLLQPFLRGVADVVYGSRFQGGRPHRILFFWHSLGNHLLTFLSNMFTDLNLTDMETCYKMFRREVIQALPLRERRFGFEPEVTAHLARIPGLRLYEVGISYYGRTYQEGKKINWRDGLRAIYCILRYNLFQRYRPGKHPLGSAEAPPPSQVPPPQPK
jgi:glycosyltransferase involved in cell wall biosynthesis